MENTLMKTSSKKAANLLMFILALVNLNNIFNGNIVFNKFLSGFSLIIIIFILVKRFYNSNNYN